MSIFELINFDCRNERFAEVFGDCIETEDIQGIMKEALKLFDKSDLRAINSADSADDAFDFIDCLTMEAIGRQSPRAKFGDRKYYLIRSFFRFVNDAYTWGDWEDLARWETELFENLENSEQKNYSSIVADSAKAYRSALLLNYCEYLGSLAPDCLGVVADELAPCEGFILMEVL